MKKILCISAIGIGIFSWMLFLLLSMLLLFPSDVIKTINKLALSSYSIEFSNLENSGNILNQNLKFFDMHIMQNDKSLLQIKEFSLGLSFKPHNIFRPINISAIVIEDGFFIQPKLLNSNRSKISFLDINDDISLSFKNLKYQKNDSIILINGDLFGKLSSSFSGQLSFLHDNQLSTLALDFSEDYDRFSLNLHSYNWLSLIPGYSASFIEDFVFKINVLGQFKNEQSIIKGSFESNSLFLNSLSLKPNRGSFHFQSIKDIGTLTLTKFLHPFVDEEYPIQINLRNKSVGVPRFSLSADIFEPEAVKLTNLTIENLFVSFNDIFPKYSGYISDLDLKDIYFQEIFNLSGNFSGYGNSSKFLLNSENAILKNHKKNTITASITGMLNFSGTDLDLVAQIKNQFSLIDLALQINPELMPLSLSLSGRDVSKELIIFSLPKSMGEASSFVDTKIIPDRQNSIYLNYKSPSSDSEASLNAKIFTNEAQLAFSKDVIVDIAKPIIEADIQNLYIFSPSGKVNNFSYDQAYGLLNFKNQKLKFYSLHDMKSIDLKQSLSLDEENFNMPNMLAEQKGEINLTSLKLNNAISVKTNKFDMPILEYRDINFNQASIFIVDMDKAYGLLPATYMQEELSIVLLGTSLIKKYNITMSTNINLELGAFIPDSDYLRISGNDFFDIDFVIQQNSPPILKINSDLKNIELNSSLNLLSKNKSEVLPTEIMITNPANPTLKLHNQQIDMHIRNFNNYDGYISIGKKLPGKFKNFIEEPGLNIYLYSRFITEDSLISAIPKNSKPASIKINKVAFDIKNFKFFNNSFSDLNGLFELNSSEIIGNLVADKLNLNLRMDSTGFMRVEIKDSSISDVEFINSKKSSFDSTLNARLIVKNSSFGKVKIKDLNVYLVNNKKNFTANNLKLTSNLISIKPLKKSSIAYFSINKTKPLYKISGDFLIKDSSKIPYLRDFTDFSYFDGSLNLQWKELSTLSYLEGEGSFILKDLTIKDSISDSLALNLLGVLNLRNILGKLANLDLSIDEYTSMQLGRVEGDLLFSKSKLRLASPLFIETNAAKMRWVGQINKNSKNNLDALDLNLDLRIRVGENIPWYAAILGGLPAVAGSAVINEIFEEDINNLTNYQYEIVGTISEPKLKRIK